MLASIHRPAYLVLVFVGVSVAAGCAGKKPESKAQPGPRWQGVALTVACPEGPARTLVERYGNAWAKKHGATLAIAGIKPGADPNPGADVWVFPPTDLARWVAADKLRLLPASVTESADWSDLVRLYRTRLLAWVGRVYAVPLLGDATFVLYRADLFREAGRQPPVSVAEYLDTAKFFVDRRGKPSLPPLPADDDGLDRQFFTLAAPLACRAVGENEVKNRNRSTESLFSFQFDAVTGDPRIDGPGFAEALAMLQKLQPFRSKAVSAAEAFRNDDAVFGIATLADLAAVKAVETPGRWGVARPPGGPNDNFLPYVGVGGMLAAVTKSAAHPDAAAELLHHLCGPEVSTEVVHQPDYGAGPVRQAQLDGRRTEGWFIYGLDQPQTARLVQVLKMYADPLAVNPAIRLRTPDRREFEKVLHVAIRQAIEKGGDPVAVLAGVKTKWKEIVARQGLDVWKQYYRRSLGLGN